MRALRYYAALGFTIVYGMCFVAAVTRGEPSDLTWYNVLNVAMTCVLAFIGGWRIGTVLFEGPRE